MDDEGKESGKDFPRQWVPTEELVKRLRDLHLPPDPTLLDEIREGGETLEDDLGDPWER
jgi:hypothetical protein